MPRYVIQLSYLGTSFHGWQIQKNDRTVQETVQNAVSTILRDKVKVAGASRTDAGVHAWDQHATFFTSESIDTTKFYASLVGVLPDEIGVKSIRQEEDDFNVVSRAVSKVYVYRIWNERSPHPFIAPFVWHYPYNKLDPSQVSEVLDGFLGEHDFKAFAATDGEAKTTVRKITDIALYTSQEDGGYLEIWIQGNGFLKQMVRNIVGTTVDIVSGKLSPDAIEKAYLEGDRRKVGICAPAPGLMLYKVFYDSPSNISKLRESLVDNCVFPSTFLI